MGPFLWCCKQCFPWLNKRKHHSHNKRSDNRWTAVGWLLPRVRTRCPWLRRWGTSDHWADSLHAVPNRHFRPVPWTCYFAIKKTGCCHIRAVLAPPTFLRGTGTDREHRLGASNEESFHMITSSFPSVTSVCAWFSLTFNVKKVKLSWEAE